MNARENILGLLRRAPAGSPAPLPDFAEWRARRPPLADAAAALALFRTNIEAAHAEVHDTTAQDWPALLARLAAAKRVRTLLYGPTTRHGVQLAAHDGGQPVTVRGEPVEPPSPFPDWPSTVRQAHGSGRTGSEADWRNVQLVPYDRPIAQWRDQLFDAVDASLTAAVSAVADTGSLILWPDSHEPRLMSLVPPIHFVLLDATRIHTDLHAAMSAEAWAARMPTNALVISGPSKTADIQQTLAYGAHGPRELIVLLCHPHGDRP